ncbi:hypothetical protein [Xanthobacter flavus]|uniref:hypothetical protein n=1 Tax=Xanthobacter flavus TaxID=281 RepID=UPI00372B26A8
MSAPPAPDDASDKAAATATDKVQTEGVDPLPTDGAGESGKASGAAAAAAPEPTHEFEVVSTIDMDLKRYEPGEPIALTRERHRELKQASAIAGDWPAD